MSRRTKKGRKTSSRALIARQRQAQALQLRVEGHPLDEIARRLGYRNRSSVATAIDAELTRHTVDGVAELRKIEGLRLLSLFQRHLPIARQDAIQAILETRDFKRGAEIARQISRSSEICVKLTQRYAKLFGLDQAVKVELGGPHGGPINFAAMTDVELELIIQQLGGASQIVEGDVT